VSHMYTRRVKLYETYVCHTYERDMCVSHIIRDTCVLHMCTLLKSYIIRTHETISVSGLYDTYHKLLFLFRFCHAKNHDLHNYFVGLFLE